ncbi:MCE family protein [Pseudonocardia alni]|uniref:MCE family protein n=1 Tax=Pseudonocardia alni TaxID=33907 RepID=UPI00368E6728
MSGQWSRTAIRLLGVGFIAMVIGAVVLTVALYEKAFTPVVPVTLQLTELPDQFEESADVKLDGLIVGAVESITQRDGLVEVRLGLDPAVVDLIPADVSARLVPKTLFGPRFVDLATTGTTTMPLAEGAVIGLDRSSSAIELQRLLDGLLPLLRQVQPQDLAMTLNAVSTALSGNGADLGETAVLLQDYVAELNTVLPDLQADISGLADTADLYTDAAPDLLDAAEDLTVTSRTVAELEAQLAALYPTVTTASDDLTQFLDLNGTTIVELAAAANPTLGLLAEYSPTFACTFDNLAVMDERLSRLWGGGREFPGLYLDIEVGGSRGKYLPGQDEARYVDDRAPYCVPGPPEGINASQYAGGEHPEYSLPGGPIEDGSDHPLPQRYQSETDPVANLIGGGR